MTGMTLPAVYLETIPAMTWKPSTTVKPPTSARLSKIKISQAVNYGSGEQAVRQGSALAHSSPHGKRRLGSLTSTRVRLVVSYKLDQ